MHTLSRIRPPFLCLVPTLLSRSSATPAAMFEAPVGCPSDARRMPVAAYVCESRRRSWRVGGGTSMPPVPRSGHTRACMAISDTARPTHASNSRLELTPRSHRSPHAQERQLTISLRVELRREASRLCGLGRLPEMEPAQGIPRLLLWLLLLRRRRIVCRGIGGRRSIGRRSLRRRSLRRAGIGLSIGVRRVGRR